MSKKAVFSLVFPAIFLLGACGKKEEPKVPDAAPVAGESQPDAAPAPDVAPKPVGLSAEERAAKLGFVAHLPQETGIVMSLINGSSAAEKLKSSEFWKIVSEETGIELGDEGAEEGEDAEPTGPAAFFSKEFTIALGPSVGDQTANLLTLNGRSTYFQMRTLTKAVGEAIKSGDFESLPMSLGTSLNQEMFVELLKDPKTGIAMVEQLSMPPLYLAFRSTPEKRDEGSQQISSMLENLGMLGEMVESVEVEKAGSKFTGKKIIGKAVSEQLKQDRTMLDAMFETEMTDRLLDAVSKKDLVVLSGTVGDYILLFIGSSVDDLVLAEEPGKSLAASDELAFCDGYAGKDLLGMVYGRKDTLSRMMKAVSGLAEMTDGIRAGLAESEGFGETRDLQTLLGMVSEREVSLRKLSTTEAYGMLAFFEDGLKIEGYGGVDGGAINWEEPNQLASLGDSADVAFFMNMTTQDSYDESVRAYFKALTETAYAITMHVAEMPDAKEKIAEFTQMAGLFDEKFRNHVVEIWEALGWDMSAGLGGENALILDLSGSVPPIPGVPQSVVDEAKFPRISLISPVKDRAKLASSWERMNVSITGVLKEVSEMTGSEIPMQKPISSERDGFTTWFFSMPFFTNDFMPSVTVGDKWFAASTSKDQALDLLAKAGTGTPAKGMRMHVNFASLSEFAEQTLDVIAKNPDAIPVEAEQMEQISKLIKSLNTLDKLTINVRRENGQLRSSVHFKTR